MENVLKRIEKMELIFDALLIMANESPDRLHTDKKAIEMLDELTRYYEGGQWLKDYRMDEKGLIPKNIKRGVLSEDGVYNLLFQIENQ